MATETPIGARLGIQLDDEYVRMANEWFFKWHQIGGDRPIEIESFRGKPICFGGIKFSGTAHAVYWNTIQFYLRKKISQIFDQVESELANYPIDARDAALTEGRMLISGFARKIRAYAVEKDRILRGDGINFPEAHDFGTWEGCRVDDIQSRADGIRATFSLKELSGGRDMTFGSLMKDEVTLTKKDGTVVRENFRASVQVGKIYTTSN